jgi:hypothetical protein
MENLISILRKETESLKNQYLEMTKKWAMGNFNLVASRKTWTELTWCEYFNLEPGIANPGTSMEFMTFPKNFFNTKQAREYSRMRDEIRILTSMGIEKYIESELKHAEQHYENSIMKLAARIELKKLNIDSMSIITGHVGVNIDMMLSDGEKYVKAYTTIAEGDIQRPHYRYYVK